jgi:phosphoribosyl-AMP cyclohydrolase
MTAFAFGPRSSKQEVEEGLEFAPKFDSQGLIPAIAQDHESGEVLMVAYMNEEALRATLSTGEAVYWSRSRQELWHKGATSGQTQTVVELRVDCDQDAIVLKVRQNGGGACHTGRSTCFYRRVNRDGTLALITHS